MKYLNREDIESLGWADYVNGNLRWYTKDGYRLVYNDINHRVHIELYTPAGDGHPEFKHRLGVLFAGTINTKSELETLMKQLGINEV